MTLEKLLSLQGVNAVLMSHIHFFIDQRTLRVLSKTIKTLIDPLLIPHPKRMARFQLVDHYHKLFLAAKDDISDQTMSEEIRNEIVVKKFYSELNNPVRYGYVRDIAKEIRTHYECACSCDESLSLMDLCIEGCKFADAILEYELYLER